MSNNEIPVPETQRKITGTIEVIGSTGVIYTSQRILTENGEHDSLVQLTGFTNPQGE